ncbi:hypothetical protein H8D36_05175 [archaeon]|nr:hypothetical protein [archaeon]
MMTNLKEYLLKTLELQKGIVFASKPTFVCRGNYSGRDIIAKNSEFSEDFVDERGYVPVELWLMSLVEAENPEKKEGEGLTSISLIEGEVTLKQISDVAEEELFGVWKTSWPLTKILDIGGVPKKTSFSDQKEVPAISPHIHGGNIVDGVAIKPGKIEAYFFPPLNVGPYNREIGRTISRLGFKSGVTKEIFKETLRHFGKDDSMYELLEPHIVKPYSGWTMPAGTIHSPGPWVTFEVQLPQDDFNNVGWKFEDRIPEANWEEEYNKLVLRGLKDEDDLINQVLDWDVSTDPNFKDHYQREIKIIEEGDFGRRFQIFFDQFYGEGWEINSGKSLTINAKEKPIAGLVWSGNGSLNDNQVSVDKNREFFIVPQTSITLENNGSEKLIMFTVEPIGGLK